MKEQVLILHGIARSSYHMRKISKFLEKNNYTVYNLDYPSTKLNLQNLIKFIDKFIKKCPATSTLHCVGYSMGGLLLRLYFNKYKIKNLGKVIQLAPPNNGSEVATFFKNFWLYKKIYGPAGQQLTTNQKDIQDLLYDKLDYPIGVIAGNFCLDPICYFLLPKPHDGKVSVASTKLPQIKNHTIVKASHSFFPYNKKVHQQTLRFLKTGKFEC